MSRCRCLAGLLRLAGVGTVLSGQSAGDPRTLSALALQVSGAPLQFRQVETNTRELPDGAVVGEESTSTVHRDSAGRVRVERTSGPGGPFVSITNPVEGYVIVLLDPIKMAVRTRAPKRPNGSAARFAVLGPVLPEGNWRPDTDTLPKRVIEGLECEGVRTTYRDSGRPGRTATYENWTVPSLGLMALVTASIPGSTYTARIERIVRGEPDPALFTIPPGYTVTELQDK
jgi:hypothetical protein